MRTLLGYVLALAVVAGIWAGVTFVPFYFDHFEVKDVFNSTFNQFRETGPEHIKERLIDNLDNLPWAKHEELDQFGETQMVKGMGLPEEAITIDFNEQTKVLDMRLEYSRKVSLRPFNKVHILKFVLQRKEKPPNVF
ncbi:MAG: hypothetical protein GQE15_28105 [Archangiaceae bacterium]|nr:hypothetical protein [Archangiaceae bacterium]